MAIQREQEEFAFYYQLLKGNYTKGAVMLQDILSERKSAESFTNNIGALMTVYSGITTDRGNRLIYDTMDQSGYMEQGMNSYFRFMGFGAKDTFEATVNDEAAMTAVLNSAAARRALLNSKRCMKITAESAAAVKLLAANHAGEVRETPTAFTALFAGSQKNVRLAFMQPEYAKSVYGIIGDIQPYHISPKDGGETVVDTGLTLPFNSPSIIVPIGETVYVFGQASSTAIYSAPRSNPVSFTSTSKNMPYSFAPGNTFITGGYIYFCCTSGVGNANVASIARAALTDPTTVTVYNAASLKYSSYYSALAVIGGYVYIYGGITYNQSIMRSPVSAPDAFVELTDRKLPFSVYQSPLVIAGDYIYIYGGYYSGSRIMRAPLSDPSNFTEVNGSLPFACTNASAAVIGDWVYIYGGNTNGGIMRAPLNDPIHFSEIPGVTLPFTSSFTGRLAVVDNTLYLYGGGNGTTNRIGRADLY